MSNGLTIDMTKNSEEFVRFCIKEMATSMPKDVYQAYRERDELYDLFCRLTPEKLSMLHAKYLRSEYRDNQK